MDNLIVFGSVFVAVAFLIWVICAVSFRVVVSTNDVHIVQSAKSTVSYGKDQKDGNTYYDWPAWMPVIGVQMIKLPVSVFDLHLQEYAAYDKGRVPFVVDIMAFFRITDSNMAAQRVSNMKDLYTQLDGILKSAARSILATSEIEEILEGRAQFGVRFTDEVNRELIQWGVQTVKNIEFMDIRDAQGSQVIANIMSKKKSLIEMQSRVEVATNMKTAQMAEIDAQRAVKTQEQDALEQIGVRTAEKAQKVGIAEQQANQAVRDQEKVTVEKVMAVKQVEQVRAAEIERGVQVVKADQQKQVAVIEADGHKQQTILVAEGDLGKAKLDAEATRLAGVAKGEAETAVLMAPVTTQVTLAKEIGSNEGYQRYLMGVKQIEANQIVGVEQAKALTAADVRVIANAGNPVEGVKSVMDLMTPKGGMQLGAMAEAFAGTEAGAAILSKFGIGENAKRNGAAHG